MVAASHAIALAAAACVLAGAPAAVAQAGDDPAEPYTQRIPGVDAAIEMVPVPGGETVIGSPPGEPGRGGDEGPRFAVRVEPLWVGRYEVTWSQYEAYLGALRRETRPGRMGADIPAERRPDAVATPSPPWGFDVAYRSDDGRAGDHPVVCVSQLAAQQFCKWLSRTTGRFYRLPTEAEWEHAARAGAATTYPWGDDPGPLDDHAWHAGNSDGLFHPVGRKAPNAYGLHDMLGNVAEWVIDGYDANAYAARDNGPVDWRRAVVWPTDTYPRVVRGGSWDDPPDRLRPAARAFSSRAWTESDPVFPPSIWWVRDAPFVGFRVVRPVNEPDPSDRERFWEPSDPATRRRLDADPAQRDRWLLASPPGP